MARTMLRSDLGEGFYLEYYEKSNGLGGYHPVEMTLYKDDEFIKKLTDKMGNFIDFPGKVSGDWEKKLTGGFEPCMDFVFSKRSFQDGVFQLGWMVQPDGRYWADEDGFGMEPDEEVWLFAKLNEKGEYVSKFEYREGR